MIPYGRQEITEEDIEAVNKVLRSDWLTQGPNIDYFESALSNMTGAEHVVASSNATAALHIACAALGVRSGDRVWTSPITFIASAYAGLYCGAEVDFVDIDPISRNISIEALKDKLKKAAKCGGLPKVVIPVHFAGHSCDMEKINELSSEFGFRVIEDAAHAVGGHYMHQPVGNCRYSDITVFSFHPVKIITSGEGGAAFTNDASLASAMRRLRSHGIIRNADEMGQVPDGPWYYQAKEIGWNYRITDIQAALGLSQLERVQRYVEARRALAERYHHGLANTGITLPRCDKKVLSAWHLYVIGWNEQLSGLNRRKAFEKLRAAGIGVQVHYSPLHLQPLFRSKGFAEGDFPEAEKFYSSAISIPLYPTLSKCDQNYVIENLVSISQPKRQI